MAYYDMVGTVPVASMLFHKIVGGAPAVQEEWVGSMGVMIGDCIIFQYTSTVLLQKRFGIELAALV